MSVLIFHWLVCRISEKLKLKRFYDHVNRSFDCNLAVGCERSIPSLQILHVLSLIAMIAMKTHHCLTCLSRYFLTCDWSIWYPYRSNNCHQPLPLPCPPIYYYVTSYVSISLIALSIIKVLILLTLPVLQFMKCHLKHHIYMSKLLWICCRKWNEMNRALGHLCAHIG